MATVVDERALDERLARLEAARPWSPRVVSRLEALIRADDDAALFRINPFTFASERGLGEDEAIDLLLHAAALGLFEMDWLLVCPRCACAVESFAGLRAVQRRFRCPECRNEYEAAMDDLIAIYFSVSPQIRAIRYHRPETLDPFDYCLRVQGGTRGAHARRRVLPRRGPLSAARGRVPRAGRDRPVRNSRPHRARCGGSARTRPQASSWRSEASPRRAAAACT